MLLKQKHQLYQYGIQGNFKLFRKIKVIYGKPIYFDENRIDIQNKEQIAKLTAKVMKEIVRLTNEKI